MAQSDHVLLLHLMDGLGIWKNMAGTDNLSVRFEVFCGETVVSSSNSKQIKNSRLMVWDERMEIIIGRSCGAIEKDSGAFIRISLISIRDNGDHLEAIDEELLCNFASMDSQPGMKKSTSTDNFSNKSNIISRKDRIVTLAGTDISKPGNVRIRIGK